MAESRFASLRNAFLTGLVLLAPVAVTWLVFSWLVEKVGGGFRDIFFFYVPETIRNNPNLAVLWDILSTLIVVIFVTGLGYVSRLFLGRYFGGVAERFIQSIPGIGSFYSSVKQFIGTFGAKDSAQFSKVVLVQYPRVGTYTIGFVTNTNRGEPHQHLPGEHWAVFIPTCPSPVNGFFLYVPAAELIELEMNVGDGMKTVISCGAVLPVWPTPAAARAALAASAPAAGN
jgi:uncharacterized membrane protein